MAKVRAGCVFGRLGVGLEMQLLCVVVMVVVVHYLGMGVRIPRRLDVVQVLFKLV